MVPWGKRLVWTLARTLWRNKMKSELVITKGTIMSCGVQPPTAHRSTQREPQKGSQQILVSESAHLIWRLWNECVINEQQSYSDHKIEQHWLSALNRRLHTDCLLTNKKKYNKKAILKSVVLRTWQGTLRNEKSLPENWTKEIRF